MLEMNKFIMVLNVYGCKRLIIGKKIMDKYF